MKICGLNMNIVWENPQENFDLIDRKFRDVNAEVLLLPEMFSTGFSMNVEYIADHSNLVLQWMQNFAKNKKAAVAGSVSVFEHGRYYNRFYFVHPDGQFQYYDKRHLFSYSGENKIYTPGDERVIVDYKGFKILLQVCYDLRFPIFSRNKGDYDLAFYVANWPAERVEAWQILLKARAVENVCYVFGLNRIGKDGNNLSYTASSAAYFADGSEVSNIEGDLVFLELSKTKLFDFRNKFGFLNDRDAFILQ